MDLKSSTDRIVDLVGGDDNIRSATHCMTRLRLTLIDDDKADIDEIRNIDGVLGAVRGAGQLQVILGANVSGAYKELVKNHSVGEDTRAEAKPKEKWTFKRAALAPLNFVAGSVTPMITGLVAGGMLKVILLLVSLPWPALAETQTFVLFTALSNVPFYFMPILIAYGTSKQLGCRPIYPIIVACLLISPEFIQGVADGTPMDLFGIPILAATYTSTMIPALLSTVAVYWAERLFDKIIPGVAKTILVGTFTIATGALVTLTVLGPIGTFIGVGLVEFFSMLEGSVGPLALGILAAVLPFMVMFGIHTVLAPLLVQNLSTLGYDAFVRPALLMHTVAEGGAAIGAGLRMKNKALRTQAFGIGATAIVAGVSEPAIYGIALRYKRPLIGVIAGAFAGGIVGGLLGAKAFSAGRNTILALPIFESTILAAIIGCVVAFAVSLTIAFALGINEKDSIAQESAAEAMDQRDPGTTLLAGASTGQVLELELLAPVDGEAIPLERVADEAFASKALGEGIAIRPSSSTVVAPTSGIVTAAFPGGHAFGITRDDGVEVLLHIGIDTVELKGNGFIAKVAQGDRVEAGQTLAELDLPTLQASGKDLTTMTIVTDPAGAQITFQPGGLVTAGQTVIADITPTTHP